nr:MAG TPA: hypothetical protein [Caudoviricetes sp.]
MSKKYIAKMNNIFFKGKRYNVGDPVLVDDKEEMNAARWETEKEYNARNEKIAQATMDLTEKESIAKINDLSAKLEDAEKAQKEAEDKVADLEKRDAKIAELEAKAKDKK